jgi:hypothetical protein
MLRITGIFMVLFSLIIAGLHDKYDLLNTGIIEIIYTTLFVLGFIVFCLSNPISNFVKSPALKIYLMKSGELFVCFSIFLASVVSIFGGKIFYGHRTSLAISLITIGVSGILGSIIKSILILRIKNYQLIKDDKDNLEPKIEKLEPATESGGLSKFERSIEGIKKDIISIQNMFSELPLRYHRQADFVGPAVGKGSELIKIICRNCDDVIKALSKGADNEGHPISNIQIAEGLNRLVGDARNDTGVIAIQLNPKGVYLYQEYLKKLDLIADILRKGINIELPAAKESIKTIHQCNSFYGGSRCQQPSSIRIKFPSDGKIIDQYFCKKHVKSVYDQFARYPITLFEVEELITGKKVEKKDALSFLGSLSGNSEEKI